MRIRTACILPILLLMISGCGGGGGNSSGAAGTNGGDINVSDYLPLKTGNSWRYCNKYYSYYIHRIDATIKINNVDVPEIADYFADGTTETGEAFYWTSDANGWTIYGHRYSTGGAIVRENPPIRVPNGLVDGATGTTGSNVRYTVKKLGPYSLYYTGETFDDTIKVTFNYGSETEYFILAKGVGLIYDAEYSLSSWTLR